MNAVDALFQRTRAEGRAALMPYLTAGFPDPAGYVDLAVAVLEAGADALEIGIPFSDPLLDGPSNQRAQEAALAAGITPLRCLEYAAAIHARNPAPLFLMGAYNPILACGLASFCRDAAAAGVSGLIVPDLPFDEQDELQAAAGEYDLFVIQLLAPTSADERLAAVVSRAGGFIYGISVAGVTGARTSVAATARPLVERIRRFGNVPVAVGFGIAGPKPAREVAAFADGVIVGSALTTVLANALAGERVERATDFIRSLRSALELAAAG